MSTDVQLRIRTVELRSTNLLSLYAQLIEEASEFHVSRLDRFQQFLLSTNACIEQLDERWREIVSVLLTHAAISWLAH